MELTKIGAFMTYDVVAAQYGTPCKDVVRLLREHRISGLPVIDEDDKVIGVISETDLMQRQACLPESRGLGWVLGRSGCGAVRGGGPPGAGQGRPAG
ncbi:CBS domain-containing protein [Streptomyces sp. NBC_00268]|uniref:CBS domain-containing protein n=1 Tax=Streptomyces sp. NBC_00268 TaxID=2975695 RepID=UPI002B1D107D|nr:CBS domain-containing protein [Streptomyces sp. NBC_00268]